MIQYVLFRWCFILCLLNIGHRFCVKILGISMRHSRIRRVIFYIYICIFVCPISCVFFWSRCKKKELTLEIYFESNTVNRLPQGSYTASLRTFSPTKTDSSSASISAFHEYFGKLQNLQFHMDARMAGRAEFFFYVQNIQILTPLPVEFYTLGVAMINCDWRIYIRLGSIFYIGI